MTTKAILLPDNPVKPSAVVLTYDNGQWWLAGSGATVIELTEERFWRDNEATWDGVPKGRDEASGKWITWYSAEVEEGQ